MTVMVNGRQVDTTLPVSLADLVAGMVPATGGVAVAVNGGVVPRSEWDRTELSAGDRVEVVVAAQGG